MYLRYGKIAANGGLAADADTLVLLKMDNLAVPTTFIDSSPAGRTVTKNGTVTQTSGSKIRGLGGAVFGGSVGDYLSIADHADFDLGAGDFTLEGWAVTSDLVTAQCLFWQGTNNTEAQRFLVYMDTGAGLRFFWKDGSVVVNNIGGGSAFVEDDVPFHWSLQREGDNVYLHKDGELIQSDTIPGVVMRNWTGALQIGQQNLDTAEIPWLGAMDEFRYSSVARYGGGSYTPP